MHEMDNTKRVITIIGLVLEIVSVPLMVFGIWILKNFENIPGFSADLADMSAEEYEFMMWVFDLMVTYMTVLVVVLGLFAVVNVYLFSKLIGNKFTEEQAKKVYLYQAIWGGVNLLFNQVTGVLYLISGVGGYNGHKEQRDIRQGI